MRKAGRRMDAGWGFLLSFTCSADADDLGRKCSAAAAALVHV